MKKKKLIFCSIILLSIYIYFHRSVYITQYDWKHVSVSAVASCTQSQKSVPLHIHFKQIVQIWNYKQPMPVMKRLGINFFQH